MELDDKVVAVLAQDIGIQQISKQARQILARQAQQKLRQLIDLAHKYMRKSHRSKLSPQDVKRALKTLQVDNIYGYPTGQQPKYTKDLKDQSLWVFQTSNIFLGEYLAEPLSQIKEPLLRSHWLAIKGKVPDIPQNQAQNLQIESQNQKEQEKIIPQITHQLSLQQQFFYNTLLQSLNTGQNFTKVLKSLRTESCLSQLLSYFCRSIYSLLGDSNELAVIDRGIQMLGALALNDYINIEPYLHQVMPCLLSGLLRSNLNESGHAIFRENTAKIVAGVCQRYVQYYDHLTSTVLNLYIEVLQDSSKAVLSHFGALKGLQAFGFTAVKSLFLPILDQYLANMVNPNLVTSEWSDVKTLIISLCRKMLAEDNSLYETLEQYLDEEFLYQQMEFSGIVKVTDLNDFLKPGESCSVHSNMIKTSSENTAKVTLSDCLACSGCITSAQSVLLEQHSIDKLIQQIDLNTKICISISQQSLATISQSVNLEIQDCFQRIRGALNIRVQLMCQSRDLVLQAAFQEFMQRYQQGQFPVITSECPGWVSFAEKKADPSILPLLSSVKSPLMVQKKILGFDGWHVGVLPCYDKKLQAVRDPSIDLVLTTKEFFDYLQSLNFIQAPPLASPHFYSSVCQKPASHGYAQFIFTKAVQAIYNQTPSVQILPTRRRDVFQLSYRDLHFCLASGFQNIQNFVRTLKQGKKDYHYIQMMACPTGCINGGGQPRLTRPQIVQIQSSITTFFHPSLPFFASDETFYRSFETISKNPLIW